MLGFLLVVDRGVALACSRFALCRSFAHFLLLSPYVTRLLARDKVATIFPREIAMCPTRNSYYSSVGCIYCVP